MNTSGPTIRADIIEVYLYRRDPASSVELLQLRRTAMPMQGTWQPVMGRIEQDEYARDAAIRETHEETGLSPTSDTFIAFHQLESAHPYLLADRDEIVLAPRFAIEVAPAWTPTLNHEHDDIRWIRAEHVRDRFSWPSQHAAISELLDWITPPQSEERRTAWEHMRLDQPSGSSTPRPPRVTKA